LENQTQEPRRLQRDPRPLYERVQALIVADIESGVYEEGGRLPTEDELALQHGISRPTVRTALANIEAIGLVRRVHGGGTFVSNRPVVVENPLDSVQGLHPHLTRRMGYKSCLSDLTIEETAADETLASRLGRDIGTPVTRVSRVVEVEGIPIAYLLDLVPEDIATVDEMRSGFRDNVLDYLADKGSGGDWYDMTVTAGRARPPVSDLLRVSAGSTLLLFDGSLVTDTDRFICISRAQFIPDSIKLTARRRVKDGGSPEDLLPDSARQGGGS
jgi:GntR family transcriptional regulator